MLKSNTQGPQHITNTETIKQMDINKYEVQSMSNKNKTYEVTLIDQGLGACSCPDFQYRMRQCKHIAEVLIKVVGII